MNNRKDILESAIKHTCGDRRLEYGEPRSNMADIGALWYAYLLAKYGAVASLDITAEDVAWMLNLMKMARTFGGSKKADTYEDAAAYVAIAGECAKAT